ncbi:helix-turn-helix transcriptional regulator [Photobacterium phosphoreum]|jgi:DNA-binding XRE family transcriptional regulator|uniref:helix-turn-helix transcriptional regulator n=1 Tax=Photobacterium phosphoreum TaxID=659 RepID=UPI0007F94F22|nr:helix-turn-helix transcriptional regulator [Photobacterium phosphoreum]OBU47643.1 hypothetical protein AYY26_01160 [Photobacterium phosphoreum]
MIKIEFHNKIRQARIESHINQTQMANKLDISRQTYVDIEKGIRIPRADVIYKIAIITTKNISHFFYDDYQVGDINQIGFLLTNIPEERKKWYLKVLKKIIEFEGV